MNLDSVRDALLADARRDAEELRAGAERDAAAALAAAHDEAQRVMAAARADGEAEARVVAAAELAQARRHARELVLAARRHTYECALAQVRGAASELRHAAAYPALVDGLAQAAHRQLGDDAVVSTDEAVGGVVASAGSRSVDYRLPTVAERCLAALGAEVEALWR